MTIKYQYIYKCSYSLNIFYLQVKHYEHSLSLWEYKNMLINKIMHIVTFFDISHIQCMKYVPIIARFNAAVIDYLCGCHVFEEVGSVYVVRQGKNIWRRGI